MDIPYGKLAVYILTFLGYIYSGYGSGLLSNLRDAVFSAETVFGDVLKNIVHIAQKFKTMHDVLDAAVEENCIFKCPHNAEPRLNRNHIPSADGCGSFGVKISTDYLPVEAMTNCCHAHDICYDTCRNVKEVCDVEFKRCLYKYCETYDNSVGGNTIVKACKGTAKVLYTGTMVLGCKSYLDAQSKACYCPSYGWKDKNNKRPGRDRNEF